MTSGDIPKDISDIPVHIGDLTPRDQTHEAATEIGRVTVYGSGGDYDQPIVIMHTSGDPYLKASVTDPLSKDIAPWPFPGLPKA